MRAMSKRDTLASVGNQIGVGKESGMPFRRAYVVVYSDDAHLDIYVVADGEGKEMVLKIHRYADLCPQYQRYSCYVCAAWVVYHSGP